MRQEVVTLPAAVYVAAPRFGFPRFMAKSTYRSNTLFERRIQIKNTSFPETKKHSGIFTSTHSNIQLHHAHHPR
jgi:hypothetical protein